MSVGFAGLVVVLLAGCAAPAPTPSEAPVSEPAPSASGPLTCDDLLPTELVAAALTGADGITGDPVPAVQPTRAFDEALLGGAGGLACTWRVGDPPESYFAGGGDWAYLEIAVLPGAAAQWVPLWAGDAPSTAFATIDGIEASTAATEGGWRISAPVGDTWAHVSITAGGLTSTGSRFDGLPDGTVSSRLADVAAAVFTILGDASSDELAWEQAELRQADAVCNGALDEGGITAAMQLPSGSTVEYVAIDPTSSAPQHFDAAVRAAARTFDCVLTVDGMVFVTITAAHGLAPKLAQMKEPDGDAFFQELELSGAPAGAEAVIVRHHDGPPSPLYLSVGGTLYELQGDVAPSLAEAIVAQAD